ncbi:hypothetical protein GS504_03880 [Rhodococcus hoagii]|nr:hypothetical protein [Prescottella equi]NKS56675.1 hypothetical protein [Prescottella equi]NKZ73247.1 hypothetical protein [Prescottella equi]
MTEFKPGDRIEWTYWHMIGRNGHYVTKRGTFVLYARKNVVVALDGNTRYSYKPVEEIKLDASAA